MKTKFRVFTALLLALMVLVSVLPLQAAAEIGQSGTATRAEAENTAEAALSVKPMLTPSYTPSASYRSGKYYTQLCNVSLTGNQRTDLVNVARRQLGYDEGDSITRIGAVIICENPRHKSIIIGKGGRKIKGIGKSARLEIEELVGTKVFLNLWVKVKDKWRDSDTMIKNLGFKDE